MNYSAYHTLLFSIFPVKLLVEDATGWKFDKDDTETGLDFPEFDLIEDDPLSFWHRDELKAVQTVFDALTQLSPRSVSLKVDECRHEKEGAFNGIPISIDFMDYAFWARKSIWSPSEASLISLGFRPSENVISSLDALGGEAIRTCVLLREFKEREELIFAANQSGQLQANGDPLDLVQWFTRLEFSLPDGLADAVARFHSPDSRVENGNVRTNLTDRERETLLRLVAAMAIRGYSFDKNAARNQATRDIQSDLDHLGIGLDQKTILKWLRQAVDLVDEEGKS